LLSGQLCERGGGEGVKHGSGVNIEHGHINFVKMLCRVVCRRGDVKRLEVPVLNTSSVCGRASVEEEVTIPGHCSILICDLGRINHTVP
jgi:hypothetical protein